MENYFASQRDNIFRNVEVLIYVFDVESRELEKDIHYYQSCLEAILQNSPEAKIFCLVHKMDLVTDEQRELVMGQVMVPGKGCSGTVCQWEVFHRPALPCLAPPHPPWSGLAWPGLSYPALSLFEAKECCS